MPGARRNQAWPRRVLLVGWDAADWQIINSLIARGMMPAMASLLTAGAWGNLATTRPILSPILWNSIATGKRPWQHGVLGFTEPDSLGTGIQPASSHSRKCKAIWNILTQRGRTSNVVGWYASHPAEPIRGVMVSNQFENYTEDRGVLSPPAHGTVHPEERRDELAPLRVGRFEIDASALLPFVPDAGKILGRPENRLGKLQSMLAQTSTIHAVATHLMTATDWDFTAVYYEGIDRFGHEFMQFHPPKMEHVSEEDFNAYRHCMTGIYRFHDMLLDSLLRLAGEETAVIVISDHGYYNDHQRPDPRPGKSHPVEWHRPFGIFAAKGPGIRTGSRCYGASILDICPTLLHLLQLPAGMDMPGRVLSEVLQESKPRPRISSWEDEAGEAGMHPPSTRVDRADAAAMVEQLAALGYIEPPSEDRVRAVQQTIISNQLHLAQAYVDSGRFRDAISIIDELDEATRNTAPVQALLATCRLGVHDLGGARDTIERFIASGMAGARGKLMLGTLELAEGNPEQALLHLSEVAATRSRLPGLHIKLGEVYLAAGRFEEAIEAFRSALAIDEESPGAFAGIARAHLETGDTKAALRFAMIAAELVHHFPKAHYIVGRARFELGDYDGAAEALELCVRQAPLMVQAQQALAQLYRLRGEPAKAAQAHLRASGIGL